MKQQQDLVRTVKEWASQLEVVKVTYKTVTELATGRTAYVPIDQFKLHEEEFSDSSKYYVTPWWTTTSYLAKKK